MGFYGGKGGRLVARLGPFQGRVQPDPPIGPERLPRLPLGEGDEIVLPKDWPSGVYLGKLTAQRGGVQSYVIFIVRDDRPCRPPLPVERHHLGGLQPLAEPVLALRRRQEDLVLGAGGAG